MASSLVQNPVSLTELLGHWHWTEDLFLSALGSALSIGGILWAAFKFFQEYRDSRYKELEQKKIEQEKKQEQLQKDRVQMSIEKCSVVTEQKCTDPGLDSEFHFSGTFPLVA